MHAAQPSVLLGALIFTLLPALPGGADAHLTHESCPEEDCRAAVSRFLEAFRSEDRNDLAALIDFPVYRGYPVVTPIARADFGARFDDLFSAELAGFIVDSEPE